MGHRIPEDVIEKVREETAIEEVVGHFLRLQRSGSSFKALCPFHQEKSPSFHVNPQRQIFHCFGCHRGGDVFRFLMDREGMSYPEAIEWCASRLGLDLSRYAPEDDARSDGRSAVLAANAWAVGYFQQRLASGAGRAARELLRVRGLRPETVESFALGLAPDDGGDLVDAARAAGHGTEALLLAGLLMRRESREPFAYFRGRLIFPIRGVAQKVLGFGGRILGTGEPKYLNSPETTVFQKRKVLYALPEARASMVRARCAILVEGYVDALALHQAGWTHAVATCGTAFAPEQATVLARYADSVVLLLDGDAAGRKASFRAAGTALAAGLDVRFGRLPTGQDPADLVQGGRIEELARVIAEAPDLVRRLQQHVAERQGERRSKERALSYLKRNLALLAERDPVRADLMMQEAESVLGIRAELLRQPSSGPRTAARGGAAAGAMRRADGPTRVPAGASGPESMPGAAPGTVDPLESAILELALASGEARALLFTRLSSDDLQDPRARAVFLALHRSAPAAGPATAALLATLPPEALPLATLLLDRMTIELPDPVAELNAKLQALGERARRAEQRLKRARMNEKYSWGDDWRGELTAGQGAPPGEADR